MSRLVSGAVFGAFATKCSEHAPYLSVRLLHARIRAPLIEFLRTLKRKALYRDCGPRNREREDIVFSKGSTPALGLTEPLI